MGIRSISTGIALLVSVAMPAYADEYPTKAVEALNQGQYLRAIEEMKVCREANETNYQCRLLAGRINTEAIPVLIKNARIYAQSGDAGEARNIAQRILAYDAKNAEAAAILKEITLPTSSAALTPAARVEEKQPTKSREEYAAEKQPAKSREEYATAIAHFNKGRMYGNVAAARLKLEELYGEKDPTKWDTLRKLLTVPPYPVQLGNVTGSAGDESLRDALVHAAGSPKTFSLADEGRATLEAKLLNATVKDERKTEFKQAETMGSKNLVLDPKYGEKEREVERLHQQYLMAKEREENVSDSGVVDMALGLALKSPTLFKRGAVVTATGETLLSANGAKSKYESAKDELGKMERYKTESVSQTQRYPEYKVTRRGSISVDVTVSFASGAHYSTTISETVTHEDVERPEQTALGIPEDSLELPEKDAVRSELVRMAARGIVRYLDHTNPVFAKERDTELEEELTNTKYPSEKVEAAARILVNSDDKELVQKSAELIQKEYQLEQSWLQVWMRFAGN